MNFMNNFGIVFDIKNIILLEEIKNELIKCFSGNDEHKIYVYTLDNNKLPRLIGQSIAAISNFKIFENFQIDKAVKKTRELIEDGKILVFTDQIKDDYKYKKAFLSNVSWVIFNCFEKKSENFYLIKEVCEIKHLIERQNGK